MKCSFLFSFVHLGESVLGKKNNLVNYKIFGIFSKLSTTFFPYLEICLLSNNIMDYYFVSQGKTTIPNVDDGEECTMTDVRHRNLILLHFFFFSNLDSQICWYKKKDKKNDEPPRNGLLKVPFQTLNPKIPCIPLKIFRKHKQNISKTCL